MLLPVGTVKRGDIVVFKYPEEPDRDFIKRVIGLPGETVEVREKKLSSTASRCRSHIPTSFNLRPRLRSFTR